MLFSLPNRMACWEKIVKHRIGQQYPFVFCMSSELLLLLMSTDS